MHTINITQQQNPPQSFPRTKRTQIGCHPLETEISRTGMRGWQGLPRPPNVRSFRGQGSGRDRCGIRIDICEFHFLFLVKKSIANS